MRARDRSRSIDHSGRTFLARLRFADFPYSGEIPPRIYRVSFERTNPERDLDLAVFHRGELEIELERKFFFPSKRYLYSKVGEKKRTATPATTEGSIRCFVTGTNNSLSKYGTGE